MPSMDQWVCDICKVKKFKSFEEACRHEEDCRKQQEQPETEVPMNETKVKPEEDAPGDSVTGGGVERDTTLLRREEGDDQDQVKDSTSPGNKRKREASSPAPTNKRQLEQNAPQEAVAAISGKRNEVNNNEGKERDQAGGSVSSARERKNPATPASTNVIPPAAVTPERRSNNSNKSHIRDRNRRATDSQRISLSKSQAKYLEKLKAENLVKDQKGSGPWALLRVFHEHVRSHDNDSEDHNAAFTKPELIKKAQEYCLKVMEDTVISDRGSETNGIGEWQSIKTLERKGLVQRRKKGRKGHFFSLTTQGIAFCQKMFSSTSSSNHTQTEAQNTELPTSNTQKTVLHYFAKK